ncbi:MAG: PAC2 family protein [Phycisphaeraceae bacterium]
MPQMPPLNDPWLIAVWPGMGGVARMAGEYLGTKLDMRLVGEFPSDRFFELDHVTVKQGVTRPGARPRCPLLLWQDPRQQHDIILLLGETQPPIGAYRLCEELTEQARTWGVCRVIAFAAMATQMHPSQSARVFGAVTHEPLLDEIKSFGVEPLEDGQIGGMNGLMLAAAQQQGIESVCLLGEMPYFATQIPNPKASRTALDVFVRMAGIELDFAELDQQAREIDNQLIQLVEQLQRRAEEAETAEDGDGGFPAPEIAGQPSSAQEPGESGEPKEPELDRPARRRIEQLFEQAGQDRSTAFQLKRELDRLGVFGQYEDRFLDLFKRGE